MIIQRIFRHDSYGTPICNRERCPRFNGKQCEALGAPPTDICEPEVRDIVKDLHSARKALSERSAEVVQLRSKADKAHQYAGVLLHIMKEAEEVLK